MKRILWVFVLLTLFCVPFIHPSESGTNDFLRIFGRETFGFEYNGYKFIGLASGPNMRHGWKISETEKKLNIDI